MPSIAKASNMCGSARSARIAKVKDSKLIEGIARENSDVVLEVITNRVHVEAADNDALCEIDRGTFFISVA